MKNRVFKFRVWHLEDQCWDNPALIEVWDATGTLKHLYDYDDEKTVIQQFTGLLDKNNKEIYEGDIIKYQYDSAYSDKFDKSVVEYEEFEPDKWGYQLGQGYGNVEIIGNIFENPDLL